MHNCFTLMDPQTQPDRTMEQRIADDQGERPGEIVRSLIRAASAKAV